MDGSFYGGDSVGRGSFMGDDAQSYKTVEVGQKIPLTPRSQLDVPSEQNDVKRASSGMLKTPWDAASQQVKPGDHKLTEVVIEEVEAKKDKDKQIAEADIAEQPDEEEKEKYKPNWLARIRQEQLTRETREANAKAERERRLK